MAQSLQTGDSGTSGAGRGLPGARDETPLPGMVFGGRYSIEREIGRGGMGRVFAAFDARLGRPVALKLLVPGRQDEESFRRFEREAIAAASLHHPNIIDVHDVGVQEGEPFIVSELLQGRTLRQRLEAGPLPPREAAAIALQLARGLSAAHGSGVVHRDLKPENLFLCEDGTLKILDFGIAKLTGAAAAGRPGTTGDFTPGTVEYMSPEQVRGQQVDQRSDIFSAGIILHEMLSGSAPFRRGSQVETGYAIISSDPPPLPPVPALLGETVARCLRKEPEARVQTAAELAEALEPLASGAQVRRWSRPRWLLLWLSLATLAGVLFAPWVRPPRTVIAGENLLAVLPFRNQGGGAEQQAFSAGLGEILTGKLRQTEQFQDSLRVVSAGEVLKEKVGGARDAREAFGATLAIGGSLRRQGEKLLVSMEMVDTRTQLVLAAREVELPAAGLPELPGRVLQAAIEMLRLQLRPEARRALAADSSAAVEFYLQGRGYLQRYDRVENLEAARRVLDRALALDPRYALAYAAKADVGLRLFNISRDPALLAGAQADAARAVELNDALAPVHITLGVVQSARGRHEEAVASLRRAVELEPRNADAWRELANAFDAAGRTADAEDTFRRAVELRENSWAAYKDLGVFYNNHGRLAEAATCFERVAALTPDSYSALSNLGGIYLRLNRMDDAVRTLRKSLALRPTEQAYANMGTAEFFQGHYREATEWYLQAVALAPAEDRHWGMLGDSYKWTGGREAESAEAYRRALSAADAQAAVDANNAQLQSRIAMYSSALGDGHRTEVALDRALRLAPDDGLVRFRAGIVRERAGDRPGALAHLKSALRAGFPVMEIERAPPLRELLRDPKWAEIAPAQSANR